MDQKLLLEEKEYFEHVRTAIEPLKDIEDMAACSGKANKVAMLIREIENLLC